MAKGNTTLPNFVGGELSPFMEGRVDLDLFAKSLTWCQNYIPFPQGGCSYRPGTYAVGLTKSNAQGVMIPFQFSANDAYVIVATDLTFRFYRNNGVILNTAKNITGITNAAVAVVTSASHGFSNGQEVYISGVEGMPEVNGRFFLVANAATNTFELQDQFGVDVDSQLYGAYSTAGTVASIYELTTPFETVNLELLRYAQTGDLQYYAARAYAPRKLTRSGHTSWTLATYTRTNDPFTGSTKWPSAVTFTADGRICFVNTQDNPEGVWESRAPNATTGATQFDDFTAGSAATDAVIFNLAPVEGIIDSVQEIKQFDRQLVLLGASSIRRLYGSNKDVPPTPTAINTQPTIEGSARVKPVVIGGTMLFVDVSGKKLKGYRYNLGKDNYEAQNYQLVAEHLGEVSFKKVLRVKGDPDAVWVLRSDGVLLSFTYNDNENIAGWARHYVGADGVVEDICTIRRDTGEDQLWLIVKRVMGGKTYRSIEVMSAFPQFPERRRFYTGNKEADKAKWANVVWERMKAPTFLDMSLTFDGSSRGIDKDATLTPSAVIGNNITVTSDNAVFQVSDIGREIWKDYASDGSGGGMAVITGFNSSTSVTCDVLEGAPFDNVSAIVPGSWRFAVKEIKNLHLYEGLQVDIQADGSGHVSLTVKNGKITLQSHASAVHVGFGFRGFFATQNVDIGGQTGPANSKPRNIKQVRVRFKDTCGAKVGPDEYNTNEVVFREENMIMGRVPEPFSGVKSLTQVDGWDFEKKQVTVIHEEPTPCTVTALDVEVDTNEPG